MQHNPIRRRDLLRAVVAGVGATAASDLVPELASAIPVDMTYKRRARYQAKSAEVLTFRCS
jgi:hypothetical protein